MYTELGNTIRLTSAQEHTNLSKDGPLQAKLHLCAHTQCPLGFSHPSHCDGHINVKRGPQVTAAHGSRGRLYLRASLVLTGRPVSGLTGWRTRASAAFTDALCFVINSFFQYPASLSSTDSEFVDTAVFSAELTFQLHLLGENAVV